MRIAAGRLAFLHASRLVQGGRGSLAGLASITAAAWASPSCSPSTSSSTTNGISFCESQRAHSSATSQLAMSDTADQESLGVVPGAVDLTNITGYLNAKDSYDLDCELMSTPGFSLEQLMELAGLAVAEAVYAVVPPNSASKDKKKILLVCGPGNNGGDGLVAARHLTLFGYDCTVVYPKQSKQQHFVNLVKQMEDVGVTILEEMPPEAKEGNYVAIVDAIFGFSFKGEGGIREPFGTIITDMIASQGKGDGSGTSIISVDVPSGWDVNGGDGGTAFMPDVLISLTSPKLSSKKFTGRHFVGGRFLPPAIAEKYGVSMPPYEGLQQVMEITQEMVQKMQGEEKETSDRGWEEEYYAYLAEKEAKIAAKEETNEKETDGEKAVHDDSAEDWAMQYQEYCIEKERALDEAEKKKKKKLQKSEE